jgi:hypothetical protein
MLVEIRSLGKTFQESVCFSRDVQGGFGGVQPLTQTLTAGQAETARLTWGNAQACEDGEGGACLRREGCS